MNSSQMQWASTVIILLIPTFVPLDKEVTALLDRGECPLSVTTGKCALLLCYHAASLQFSMKILEEAVLPSPRFFPGEGMAYGHGIP